MTRIVLVFPYETHPDIDGPVGPPVPHTRIHSYVLIHQFCKVEEGG